MWTEGCRYGDKAPWCSSYVRSADDCQRTDIARYCCHSCARHLPTTTSTNVSPISALCNYLAQWTWWEVMFSPASVCRQIYNIGIFIGTKNFLAPIQVRLSLNLVSHIPLAKGDKVIKFWKVMVKGQSRWGSYALYWALLLFTCIQCSSVGTYCIKC